MAHRYSIVLWLVFVGFLGAKTAVFFSPDDRPKHALIGLIDHAGSCVYGAVYMLTEPDIIKALQRAKKRGVDVQLVVDSSSLEASYNKILISDTLIPLYAYGKQRGGAIKAGGLMHHKFAIIDNHVVTGSFNWTRAASNRNQENLVITDNKELLTRFQRQFALLKERCIPVHLGQPQPSTSWWQRMQQWYWYGREQVNRTLDRIRIA